ncbi:MAG: hypothetical protein HY535_03840 [Chloroflexi bacterium]|nr:hypothetical protein [Chloroflexota bacterium]
MAAFIRETKGNDRDLELYRGFMLARCLTRVCARLAEGPLQKRVAEFLKDSFYDRGIRAVVSEGRHITGAFCCVIQDARVQGLPRQVGLLREAIDAFWADFHGTRTFDQPTGEELYQEFQASQADGSEPSPSTSNVPSQER